MAGLPDDEESSERTRYGKWNTEAEQDERLAACCGEHFNKRSMVCCCLHDDTYIQDHRKTSKISHFSDLAIETSMGGSL